MLPKFLQRLVKKQQTTASNDPEFFGKLDNLPNPDPILRKMGAADKVYASILSDAHVIGELRGMRGALCRQDYRLVAGGEESSAIKALELCQLWMNICQPSDLIDWDELLWQMVSSVYPGFKVHELVWEKYKGWLLPMLITDVRNGRCSFDVSGQLRIASKQHRNGQAVDPRYYITSRHMPSATNPYGEAMLSRCFWPWTFKTGGFQYFVQYCERFGLPWPIARYPQGTQDGDIDKLESAVAAMLSNGYVVTQEGNAIEILTPTSGSALPQERLIDLCNREMSKALTGQAMVAELGEVGARAASETAEQRQYNISDADRKIAVSSFNRILKLITQLNFGDDIAPPKLEFYKPQVGDLQRAQVYEISTRLSDRVSLSAYHEEMGIALATDDDDVLKRSEPVQTPPSAAFSAADNESNLGHEAMDEIIADEMIEPVSRMLKRYEEEGKSLAEFSEALTELVDLEDDQLQAVMSQALQREYLEGMADE